MIQNKNSKNLKLWQKCFITFAVLLLYRILCTIPTPGVNSEYFSLMVSLNSALGFLNAFSGNNLSSLSIMALNITPYISASIVIQLLTSSFDGLKRLARGTPKDKKKISNLTMVFAGIFAFTQALGMAITLGRDGLLMEYNAMWVAIVVAIWTASSIIIALVGKAMDEKKNVFVGKGVSLFLFTNIISAFPGNIKEVYTKFIAESGNAVMWSAIGTFGIFILFTVIAFLHESEKRIEVAYTTNVVYKSAGASGKKQIVPIKLMPASVMPVIFASSLFSLPNLIAMLLGKQDVEWIKYLNTALWFSPADMKYSLGCILYVLFIFMFGYFYINVFLNPAEIAEDLQKAGAFVVNMKTNSDVAKYFKKHIYQMALVGSVILSVISVIPFVLSGVFGLSQMSFLGTSVLIIVSTVLETYKDIASSKIVEDHNKKTGGLFNG